MKALASLSALGLLALGVAGCGEAPPATAQGAPAGQQNAPPVTQADSVQLVFEREVFRYPSFARRNPFAPITAESAGPRFEDMELRMVILFEGGPGSIATLSARGGDGTTYRVREGDRLGNMRVVSIRLREIVVDVEEFGGRERRVLELRREEPTARLGDVPADTIGSDTIPPATVSPAPMGAPPPDTTVSIPGNRNGGSA
jgi:hypothetical protein